MLVDRNPNSGLVGVIVVLVVTGMVLGLALSTTDLMNPNQSVAEARAKDAETQVAAQKADIDLAYYRAARAADQEKLWLEVEARKRELEQNLRLAELTRYVLLGSGGLSMVVVSSGLAAFLVLYGRGRWTLAKSQKASPAENWQDPHWRAEQIYLAREQERERRQATLAQKTTTKTRGSGNGQY
jgi:hypothetical protein